MFCALVALKLKVEIPGAVVEITVKVLLFVRVPAILKPAVPDAVVVKLMLPSVPKVKLPAPAVVAELRPISAVPERLNVTPKEPPWPTIILPWQLKLVLGDDNTAVEAAVVPP